MILDFRALLRLLPMVLVLGSSSWTREFVAALEGQQRLLAGYLPYLLFGLSAVVALLFNRARFLAAAVLGGFAYHVVQTRLQASLSDPAVAADYLALCFGFAGTVAVIGLLPERGARNQFGAFSLMACAVAYLLFSWLPLWAGGWWPERWIAHWPGEAYVMSRASTLLYLLVAGLSLVQLLRRGTHAEAALVATLVAGYLALARLDLAGISVTQFSLAGMLQLLAVLRSSHDMAYRDELTGLPGRRALEERLKGLVGQYSLAMLDVDHFKKFNDNHGHDVGDQVLKLVASRLGNVGSGGRAYRYGGEEFCIVFPGRHVSDCTDALEELRKTIAGYQMALRDRGQRPRRQKKGRERRGKMATRLSSQTVSVTVSIGAAMRESSESADDVVQAADRNLYRAKRAGRNRLVG